MQVLVQLVERLLRTSEIRSSNHASGKIDMTYQLHCKIENNEKEVWNSSILEKYDIDTHLLHKGKYQCTVELLFDWFGFGQTSKSVVD